MGERAYINSLESRAVGLMREGRLDEAENSFRAAMDRKASAGADAMSMNNLGTVHLRQNRIAEAMEEFEQALRIRERANADSPSSRGSLELGMIQRNLATAKRLAASHGYSGKPAGSRGWAVARDMLHKLSRDELQLAARRLGVGVEGSDEQMAQGIRAAVGSGDVNDIVQREMIRATFDLLDLDGDGELTKVEVLKGLRSSDKIKKLLELPDKARACRHHKRPRCQGPLTLPRGPPRAAELTLTRPALARVVSYSRTRAARNRTKRSSTASSSRSTRTAVAPSLATSSRPTASPR